MIRKLLSRVFKLPSRRVRPRVIPFTQHGVRREGISPAALKVITRLQESGFAAFVVGGAVRDERVWYSWPGARTYIPELANVTIACSDLTTTTDGICDVSMDTYIASLMTVLQPECNPGQAIDPVPLAFSTIIGYQRGTPKLKMATTT